MNDMEPQWSAPRHPVYEYEYANFWFLDHLTRRVNDFISKSRKDPEARFTVYRNRHNTSYLEALTKETYKWKSCRKAILDLAGELKRRNIKFYVFIVPDFGKDFKKYIFSKIHTRVKDLCRGNNIKVVDLFDSFSGRDSDAFQVNKEDKHPNSDANSIIASEIYTYLQENAKEL